MQNESHTSEPKNDQRVLRERLNALEVAEANGEASYAEFHVARRAYFAAVHAATDDDSVPDSYGANFMRAVKAAKKVHDAARARLAVIENNPDNYSQADYVDAAVAESNAEERHHLISMQWEGHLEWQREQRLQSTRPRVRVKLKRRRYGRRI